MSETLQVTYVKTRWQAKPDEDGLTWGIYIVDTPAGAIVAKGKIDPKMCQLDMAFNIVGRWETDKKYGRQFAFHNYARCNPNGRWGNIAFIMQAEGIGEKTAERIFDKFGEDSIKTLIEEPEKVAAEAGVRAELTQGASEYLGPLLSDMKTKLPLLDLFKGTRIAAKTAQRVLDLGWKDPVTKIKDNPFVLMKLTGIAFLQCDGLRQKLKYPKDMPERIVAACQQTFTDCSDQTWLQHKDVLAGMQRLLEIKGVDVLTTIKQLVEEGTIVQNDVGEGDFYALTSEYADEKYVAHQLYARMNMPGDAWPIEDIANDPDLDDHQKEVILHNMRNGGRLIILTGSPGTGKTFCLGKIIKYFVRKNMAYEHCCAPTGKAAQRLSQSLRDNGVDQDATTIHRMLEPLPVDGGWAFRLNGSGGYVDADIIAVDETSMVNNWLGARMFQGINPNAYIILVGDKNQLPPVGPGTMLRDLEELPNFRALTQVRRNAGKIVDSCAKIRDGKPFEILPERNPGQEVGLDNNAQLVLASKDDKKPAKVRKFVESLLAGKVQGVRDILEDVQFLTATHRNAHVGRIKMNKMLQEMLNPNGKGKHPVYKVGDKIICTENTQIEGTENEDGKKEFVANGELGYVLESHEKWIVVKMNGSNRKLRVTCGKDVGNGWDLGYCITTHKSQGSEWPVTVTLMGDDYGSSMVMCREWIYTALSRAKFCSIVVAAPQLIKNTVKRIRIWDRKSFILERLEDISASQAIEQSSEVEATIEDGDEEPEAAPQGNVS